MYKGKRKRLRKKDLNEVNTFNFLTNINLKKATVTLKGGKRRFFQKSMSDKIDIYGNNGDVLQMSVLLSLINNYGVRIIDDLSYVLLPEVEGRKYYWVDEEQA